MTPPTAITSPSCSRVIPCDGYGRGCLRTLRSAATVGRTTGEAMKFPPSDDLTIYREHEREALRRVVRARQNDFRQHVEWHLWPLVMSGVPSYQLSLAYMS